MHQTMFSAHTETTADDQRQLRAKTERRQLVCKAIVAMMTTHYGTLPRQNFRRCMHVVVFEQQALFSSTLQRSSVHEKQTITRFRKQRGKQHASPITADVVKMTHNHRRYGCVIFDSTRTRRRLTAHDKSVKLCRQITNRRSTRIDISKEYKQERHIARER
jgi:hypothetical protein